MLSSGVVSTQCKTKKVLSLLIDASVWLKNCSYMSNKNLMKNCHMLCGSSYTYGFVKKSYCVLDSGLVAKSLEDSSKTKLLICNMILGRFIFLANSLEMCKDKKWEKFVKICPPEFSWKFKFLWLSCLLYNLFLKIELITGVCFYVGIPSEGDAGNSFPSYLAGWVYSRPRHWFLAH